MDSESFVTALNAVFHRLTQLATEDAQLRTELRRLGKAIFEITDIPGQPVVAVEEPAVQGPPVVQVTAEVISPAVTEESAPPACAPTPAVVPEAAPSAPSVPPPAALPEATLDQAKPAIKPATVPPTRRPRAFDSELLLIQNRCRLKGEAARWAVTRSRLLAEGTNFRTEIQPKDEDLIAKAASLDACFLWMSHLSGKSPNHYEDFARCFDAVADVVSLVMQIQDEPNQHPGEFERCLDLLAEAQSALRVAIGTVDGPTDTDQTQVYNWLKATASKKEISIQRHMRIDDPADSSQWADLASRIEKLHSEVQAKRR